MRETCTSGSVGGEGGNILTYPAARGPEEHEPALRYSIFTPASWTIFFHLTFSRAM